MGLDRGKLANIDRRLLAELDREETWQVVKVPASNATWSTWKRYCDVVGLSMGRAISALIDSELTSAVDDEVDARSAVFVERERQLDERSHELDNREREIERRERMHGPARQPTRDELERMADEIEPRDSSWVRDPSTEREPDIGRFKGVGRNEKCPCGSGRKFKTCHWDWYRDRS
jgi:hypothetical protein